jgi:hypothetical protein
MTPEVRKVRFRTDHSDPVVRELERARERLRLSQRGMAQALQVPFRTYQKWVYTDQKPRDPETLLARAGDLIVPRRVNCWDALNCGRGPGGPGRPCPAATDTSANGVNGGINAGRVCWAIAGTFCEDKAEGVQATNLASCFGCQFFRQVLNEEGLVSFKLLKPGQTYKQPWGRSDIER